jgi:uncharacterized protein with HEPN domain
MQPNLEDMARLWDMLDAAKAATEFTKGKRFEDLMADRMLRNAVERNLEIIGEAAKCCFPCIPRQSSRYSVESHCRAEEGACSRIRRDPI